MLCFLGNQIVCTMNRKGLRNSEDEILELGLLPVKMVIWTQFLVRKGLVITLDIQWHHSYLDCHFWSMW